MANPVLQFLGGRPLIGSGRTEDYIPAPPDLSYLGGSMPADRVDLTQYGVPAPIVGLMDEYKQRQKSDRMQYDAANALHYLRSLRGEDPQYGEKAETILQQFPGASEDPHVLKHIELQRTLAPHYSAPQFDDASEEEAYNKEIQSGIHPLQAQTNHAFRRQDRILGEQIDQAGLDSKDTRFVKDGHLDAPSVKKWVQNQGLRDSLAAYGYHPEEIDAMADPKTKLLSPELVKYKLARPNDGSEPSYRGRSGSQLTETISQPWIQEQKWKQTNFLPKEDERKENEFNKKQVTKEIVDSMDLLKIPKDRQKIAFNEDGSPYVVNLQRLKEDADLEKQFLSSGGKREQINQSRDPETGFLDPEHLRGFSFENANLNRQELSGSEANNLQKLYEASVKAKKDIGNEEIQSRLVSQGIPVGTSNKQQWNSAKDEIYKESPEYQGFKAQTSQKVDDLKKVDPIYRNEAGVSYPTNTYWDPKKKQHVSIDQLKSQQSGPPAIEEKKKTASLKKEEPPDINPDWTVAQQYEADQKRKQGIEEESKNADWTAAKQALHQELLKKIPANKLQQFYTTLSQGEAYQEPEQIFGMPSGSTRMIRKPMDKVILDLAGIDPNQKASEYGLKAKVPVIGTEFSVKDLLTAIAKDPSTGLAFKKLSNGVGVKPL